MRSDAKWYVDRTSGPVQEFYDIFFRFTENTMSLGVPNSLQRTARFG